MAEVFGRAIGKSSWLPVLWGVITGLLIFTAAISTDVAAQTWLAGVVVLVLLIMRSARLEGTSRVLFIFLALYLTLRYLFWRTFNTLGYSDFFSFIAALLLYSAELYGITIYLLGAFVNIQPLRRTVVPLPADQRELPSVDVLIPTYNEPPEMLEVTLLAATQIRYPKEKLRVYLLDDGGTKQKREDPSPVAAAAAFKRHQTLVALCERVGAHYISREKNEHAKAGNINSALKVTHGDLLLMLDADHVPTVDILEKTVGLFVRDDKLFLVQTPHFFVNPDPIEKNLRVFGQMPSENEMFYSVIHHGLDSWNASFFCGSAALLRRKHLEEIGGLSHSTVTEDAETALVLHAKGYSSAYINHPMISGLQAETYASFIVQRMRWAQGMVQIFLLKNPLLVKGLRLSQRLCYLNSSFYWFFGYARMTFLLAPAAYLLFGLRIYDANLNEFIGYTVPHLVASLVVSDYLFGKVRWAFVSELYEIMQSLFVLPGIFKVLKNPHSATFKVTPKREHLDQDFISKLSGPFYVVYLLTLGALIAGVYRYFHFPYFLHFPNERDTIYITMGWELFNLLVLNAAIGALFERRQRRLKPRMPADFKGELVFDGRITVACHLNDLSVSGALSELDQSDFDRARNFTHAELRVFNTALEKFSSLHVRLCEARPIARRRMLLGIEFIPASQKESAGAVALAQDPGHAHQSRVSHRGARLRACAAPHARRRGKLLHRSSTLNEGIFSV